jgi:cellulose synthase/poly-beta-1,6-N-acetylglucosamine synthase-like glycosyltransferase
VPQFSVIIPSYNRVKLIRRALDSVLTGRFRDSEIIVIDDGSTDGTCEFLESLKPAVRFWTQPNSGPSSARNLGASYARGTYLAFLDSDDLWFPWTLDVYASVLANTNAPAFIAGKPRCFHSENELLNIREDTPRWQEFSDYLESGDQWRWWGVSSFVVRRQTFNEVGGFAIDLKNGEDSDLALRIGTAPGFVQITAPFTFAYREHVGNIAGDLDRNAAALQRQIHAECSGRYPGGAQRRRQRQRILTRHVRPVALACAKAKKRHHAWFLYWSTFVWHVAQTRWRFLIAFPFLALFAWIGNNRRNSS